MTGVAMPMAYVDIWQPDGGVFRLTGSSGLLEVTTHKNLWDTGSGTFELILQPGGPYGMNVSPQWNQVLRPMSLVIIGMQRQGRAHIVMAGIITNVEQDTAWQYNGPTQRITRITGADFGWYFNLQTTYTGLLLQFGIGALLGTEGAIAQASQFGYASGAPWDLAQKFWNQIMAGKGGFMSGTKFNYDGESVTFGDLVETSFAKYPGLPVLPPCSFNFIALSGSWASVFLEFFPFPYYEFFVTTAEPGQYGQGASAATLSISDLPFFPPANPVAVARPMPLPRLTGQGENLSLDMSDWNNLPVYVPDSIIRHSEAFDVAEVRNMFVMNPRSFSTQWGGSNQSNMVFVLQYGAWIDTDSIKRYGYNPRIDSLLWFSDPQGNQAQANASNAIGFQQTIEQLSLAPVSWHTPAPLMAKGSLTTTLRPDIAPGVRVQYAPEKSNDQWQFYCHGVSHKWAFGQQSTTTLMLARGLPLDVYTNGDLLLALHRGLGAVVDGEYFINGNSGIRPFNQKNADTELNDLSNAFTTPGAR